MSRDNKFIRRICMIEIAKNDYYTMTYDETDNCIYWVMRGFWKDMSVVSNFNSDWDKAIKATKPGWKIFSDARQCKVVPPEVQKAKIQNQKRLLKSGCIKIARIVDSAITKMSLGKEINEPGMAGVIKQFSSEEITEAKKWLKE
jgi:hypothetical protein